MAWSCIYRLPGANHSIRNMIVKIIFEEDSAEQHKEGERQIG